MTHALMLSKHYFFAKQIFQINFESTSCMQDMEVIILKINHRFVFLYTRMIRLPTLNL
jgi:hypothetical protein